MIDDSIISTRTDAIFHLVCTCTATTVLNMGKKNTKKDVEKKLALAARKEAKQEKSARKRLAKEQGVSLEEPDDELDQVLQAYKSQDKAAAVAIGEGDKPILGPIETPFPLPRANATFCDIEGEKRDYFYLFGGEYFDGVTNIFLDDLLRYEALRKEWKQIITAPRPSPRCAHSCVSYKNCLYVFGGELETADQYHHYRDLWKFDASTLKWTEIAAKNSPSARSGHAAFVWKNYMILFGGFFEAVRDTKWYNDVSVFNLQTETWMDVPQSRLAAKPEPRSACNIASFGTDKVIIHGGFSKMKSVNSSSETKVHSDAWVLHLAPLLQQKPPTWERWMSSSKGISNSTPSGRAGTSSIGYKGRMLVFGGVVDSEQQHHKVDSVFYNSLMALDIERRKWFPLRVKEKTATSGGRRRRKQKEGNDGEDEKEQVENASEENGEDDSSTSDFDEEEMDPDAADEDRSAWDIDMLRHNMFAFVDGDGNIGKNIHQLVEESWCARYVFLNKFAFLIVYEKIEDDEKKDSDEPTIEAIIEEEKEESEGEEEKEEDEEEDEEKEEEKEEANNTKSGSDPMPQKEKSAINTAKITSSSVMTLNPETNVPEAVERSDPLPRINSSVVIAGHTLYLFGGILEVGDREVTLDDMWALDLRKRESWECIWPGTMHRQVWRGAIFDDDDSYLSTGKEDGSDDDDSMSDDEEGEDSGDASESKPKKSSKKNKKTGLRQEVARLNEKYNLDDENRTPVDKESLADFYSRTSKYWNGQAADALNDTNVELSNKELKREGFKLAQERYDELKPVLDRLAALSINSKQDEKCDSKKEKKSKKSSKR